MIPRFLYPLLPYRSFFLPFLALSAIVAPCWLVVRLLWLRGQRHGRSVLREILLLTFVVYLCGLAVATLTPNRNSQSAAESAMKVDLHPSMASLTCRSPALSSHSTARSFCMHNARGNVALFFPLGLLIPLVWRRLRLWKTIPIAAAVSVSIEIFQYLSRSWSNRSADANDVILNVAGATLGLKCGALMRSLRSSRPAGQSAATTSD